MKDIFSNIISLMKLRASIRKIALLTEIDPSINDDIYTDPKRVR